MDLKAELGDIDIYLLDQVLRGRVPERARVLDVGCGSGRNLVLFLRRGDDVWGLDPDSEAVAATRGLAASLGRPADEHRFMVGTLDDVELAAASFDLVICNAVLHFARDPAAFQGMVAALRDLLRPGGLCFTRLASTIGLEAALRPAPGQGERWALMPDGTERFMVDLDYLLETSGSLGLELVDPIKTTNVQNLRCMTTWVWRRG